MDPHDKTRFEIHGKSSVKYHLKANHVVEAKRWFWALNNAVQWSKDEIKEEERRREKDAEMLRLAWEEQSERQQRTKDAKVDGSSLRSGKRGAKGLQATPAIDISRDSGSSVNLQGSSTLDPGTSQVDDGVSAYGSYEPSLAGGNEVAKVVGTTSFDDGVYEDLEDENASSSREIKSANKDAFNITAQSAKMQLDLLTQVMSAMQAERSQNPHALISDPSIVEAMLAYESAVRSLKGLLGDLLKISRDRDAYWQYRLDREVNVRRLWEETMAKVAKEQEQLESKIGESEEKRKRTKRALRQALEGSSTVSSRPGSRRLSQTHDEIAKALDAAHDADDGMARPRRKSAGIREASRKKSVIAELADLSDSGSEDDEEFFDAVDAGEIEVVPEIPPDKSSAVVLGSTEEDGMQNLREARKAQVAGSFKGYEDPIRTRLKLDADNRPKVSLWVCLISTV